MVEHTVKAFDNEISQLRGLIAEVEIPSFDLALRKTVATDIVGPGDEVPFTITAL